MAQPAVKVLIADDDETMVMLLRKGIEGPGYQIAAVGSGKEAVDLLAEVPIDIVLSDISMPRPTGLELTQIIREKHPNTDVIILTASITMDTVVKAINAGAYDYLSKPFDLTLVRASLRRCVEKRALQAELAAAKAAAKEMGERLSQLKDGVDAAQFGEEHESCREFAQKVIADIESRLSAFAPRSAA